MTSDPTGPAHMLTTPLFPAVALAVLVLGFGLALVLRSRRALWLAAATPCALAPIAMLYPHLLMFDVPKRIAMYGPSLDLAWELAGAVPLLSLVIVAAGLFPALTLALASWQKAGNVLVLSVAVLGWSAMAYVFWSFDKTGIRVGLWSFQESFPENAPLGMAYDVYLLGPTIRLAAATGMALLTAMRWRA